MTEDSSNSRPRIGQIVKSSRGRDQGQYAVVIKIIDDRFVYIADGDKRKFDKPKKKNVLHLLFQQEISSEIAKRITDTGRVSNGKLRFAIQRFTEQQQQADT